MPLGDAVEAEQKVIVFVLEVGRCTGQQGLNVFGTVIIRGQNRKPQSWRDVRRHLLHPLEALEDTGAGEMIRPCERLAHEAAHTAISLTEASHPVEEMLVTIFQFRVMESLNPDYAAGHRQKLEAAAPGIGAPEFLARVRALLRRASRYTPLCRLCRR